MSVTFSPCTLLICSLPQEHHFCGRSDLGPQMGHSSCRLHGCLPGLGRLCLPFSLSASLSLSLPVPDNLLGKGACLTRLCGTACHRHDLDSLRKLLLAVAQVVAPLVH